MGKQFESLKKRYKDGKYAHEMKQNIIGHKGLRIKTAVRYYYVIE